MRVLKEVDAILAEDTRTSKKLMMHLGLSTPLSAFHQHNEHQALERVMDRLKNGDVLALISDAGMPGISDPGFLLVRECIRSGIAYETLPGPSALLPALVNSGLPTDRFTFEGFLPHKKGRQTRIARLTEEDRTMVFFESPHRLLKTLEQLSEAFGKDRQASVSRELTKLHEENITGTLSELHSHFSSKAIKGEIVLVVAGCAV